MKRKLLIIIFLIFTLPSYAAKKYVSPSGSSSNSGSSVMEAWSLSFALGATSPLSPGDSLILADGVYPGNYISEVNGSAANPIKIMAMTTGKAIIDIGINGAAGSGIIVNGNNTWFIGIHVTSSDAIRQSDDSNGNAPVTYESGIAVYGNNNKLINCWVYNVVGGGLELWRSGLNLEVYGCIIFNNGSQDALRGHGHGMYIQHDDINSPKQIVNNFVFQNASQGINIYTTNPVNRGMIIDRNVSFNTGVIANFNPILFRPPHNLTIGSKNNVSSEVEVRDNMFYSDLQGGRLEPSQVSNVTLGRTYFPNANLKFLENKVYGGRNQVEFLSTSNLEFRKNLLFKISGKFFELLGSDKTYTKANWNSNTYVNFSSNTSIFDGLSFTDWKKTYGFDSDSQLFSVAQKPIETLVVQNKYVPNQYYVTILNLSNQEIIDLDFSEYGITDGQDYVIRDVQNPFDQEQRVVAKTNGNMIPFPMNWTKSLQPKGNMPHQVKHTDKTFGTFILEFSKVAETKRPDVKDSVAIYLNNGGEAYLTSVDFLNEQPGTDFTFASSQGFQFDCNNLGLNEITITSTNSASGDKWEDETRLFVLDTIKPYFTSISKTFEFDPVVGKVEFNKDDFAGIDIQDNCAGDFEMTFGRSTTITCADLQEYYEKGRLDVDITVSDQSKNKFTVRSFITLNVIESVKVSLTANSESQEGDPVKLSLGSEFAFEVLGWYRGEELLSSSSDKQFTVTKSGVYKAKLKPVNGCEVFSKPIEVTFEDAAEWPVVKDKIEMELVKEGKATLKPEQVFTKWPISSEFTVELSKSDFTCDDLWSNIVVVKITDSKGTVEEKEIEVIVRDKSNPVLVTKNVEVVVDLSIGKVDLNPEDFIASLTDNCGIKEITLSRQSVGCEDIGKEITVEVGAVDKAENIMQRLAKVTVKSTNSRPVTVSGPASICIGNDQTLTLESEAEFEVVRWRRNGTEINGATGKTLAIEEGGSYHAIVRYAGGCLFETAKFEVESLAKPSGEIEEDGNILRAPEGNFTYQWFRNGDKLDDATQRTLTVNQMGEYAVELINEAGCMARLAAVTVTISGLFNPGILISEELKIYPNPASSEVEIQALGDLEFAENSMSIYNSNGKEVSSSVEVVHQSPNKVTLAISRLAAGTYLIMIESPDNRVFVGKLVKR
ncbi:T9SS type A sorting domain-containing protein [Algoriphagus sp. D3-2-R+10]|uniref:T9SS type A sorting domain-containing protein n=1 Tax=Algoriphagus aurantiacus TaxID=3103948 RepID=UPI002B371B0C|nr:T9SS type A sorting domain-containing protein [Algoriphagus sp. D3-2-R+10]MEB2778079.1 T9SS type A sorting domain-containing protein [Algoriphagus sp. D3-2-R+10]